MNIFSERCVKVLIGVCALVAALPATQASADVSPASAPAAPSLDSLLGSYNLDESRLLEPFWRSKEVDGETVLFVKEADSDLPTGRLLFVPGKMLRARNERTGEAYELGRDYEVDAANRRLILTKDSKIPFLKKSDFYKPKGAKQAIKFKVDDPNTWLLWMENGFQELQVAVDYERAEEWAGYVPRFAGEALPRVIRKLRNKEHVQITVVGDSISAGANSSGLRLPPHQPPYTVLVAAELEKIYGAKIDLANFSVGGSMANGAMKKIAQVIETKPDLVIIGYGMNDVATRNAAKYADNITNIMEVVRTHIPDAEFLLVASSRANPEWNWTPADQFPRYRDALAALVTEHVAVADMTALWTQMLEKKRYHDLTGNGVNHPNDFGHRLYAQVIVAMLASEDPRTPRGVDSGK